jgi:hypothetical protein
MFRRWRATSIQTRERDRGWRCGSAAVARRIGRKSRSQVAVASRGRRSRSASGSRTVSVSRSASESGSASETASERRLRSRRRCHRESGSIEGTHQLPGLHRAHQPLDDGIELDLEALVRELSTELIRPPGRPVGHQPPRDGAPFIPRNCVGGRRARARVVGARAGRHLEDDPSRVEKDRELVLAPFEQPSPQRDGCVDSLRHHRQKSIARRSDAEL